jgi:uncharacterized membrane protein YfcA
MEWRSPAHVTDGGSPGAAASSQTGGVMVSHLGGGDISWILGLIVATVLYYVLHRGVDVMPHKAHEVSTTSASSEGMVTQ